MSAAPARFVEGSVSRAWAWALGLSGVALLVLPLVVFTNVEDLLLPAIPWMAGC